MNQEPPEDYLERKVVHTAANRGLNQRIDSEIPPSAWSILKYILPVIYSVVCIIPGLTIAYMGLSVILHPHPIAGSYPLTGLFIILVGLGAIAIGVYLVRFILKKN